MRALRRLKSCFVWYAVSTVTKREYSFAHEYDRASLSDLFGFVFCRASGDGESTPEKRLAWRGGLAMVVGVEVPRTLTA